MDNETFTILGEYGQQVHIWDWEKRTLKQSITVNGPAGITPFEIRFLHNPEKPHAFFLTAIGSAVYHLYHDEVWNGISKNED